MPRPISSPSGLLLLVTCVTAMTPTLARGEGTPVAGPPVNVASPTVSGTPAVGQTLSCSTGAWGGAPSGFGYVWLRDGSPIAGQTGSTYLAQAVDRGHSLSCRVTASVEAGGYTIIGLPTGLYKVTFRAGGEVGNYLTTYFHQELAPSEANRVSVTAGAITSGIDAAMPTGGAIVGTVRDAATHAGVAAVGACAETEGRQEACTKTNAAGEYTLSGLPTGSYSIWYTYDSGLRGGWSWTGYYDGKATRGEANQVAVAAGSVTSGIDVEMSTGQIVGTVTSAVGKAALGRIEVCASSRGELHTMGCALTDATGRYTITGLSAGAYTVQFSSFARNGGGNYVTQFYDGASLPSQAAAVTVAAGSTTAGTDAELQTGGQVSGTVTSASTHTPLEGVFVCAAPVSGFESGQCTSTDAAGQYTIAGLSSGSYQVQFGTEWESVNSDYLGEYFDGKSSRGEATLVVVSAGSTTGGVDAELPLGGQITGRVTSATEAGIAGVTVCAEYTGGFSEVFANQTWGGETECAITAGAGATASATSNALAVPAGSHSQIKLLKVRFDRRRGRLDFFFQVQSAGSLRWQLFFENAQAAAARLGGHRRKCKHGEIRHGGRCLPALAALASGARQVHAGAVEIEVRPDAKARRVLRAGRVLHIRGKFSFKSRLGGSASVLAVAVTARGPAGSAKRPR